MKGRHDARLDALESARSLGRPAWPKGVFLLDEGETLPDGLSADDPELMVIRLVAVDPVHDANGSVIPRRA